MNVKEKMIIKNKADGENSLFKKTKIKTLLTFSASAVGASDPFRFYALEQSDLTVIAIVRRVCLGNKNKIMHLLFSS